ncbi:hypothetical protein [Cytobacillus sp. Bac17]|uniref:Uncharacterized protein n=1 Tax=Cytobacillus oceanisediminis TaxID=665099 RepID=A0ABX3CMU0_9BACI|nr:hypothetical protein [Cytobacillus sp. Bac17]OHX44727.1 hypothetical protein BBV17_24795 [Cytobacillus oceanisediminis]
MEPFRNTFQKLKGRKFENETKITNSFFQKREQIKNAWDYYFQAFLCANNVVKLAVVYPCLMIDF